MKKLVSHSMFLLVACLVNVQPRAAQGAVVDWIHRLSGPSMLGPAVSYYSDLVEDGLRFRVTGA
jgi:hypothetical protein